MYISWSNKSFPVACLNYEAKFEAKTTANSGLCFFRKGLNGGGVPKPSSQPKFSADPSSQPNVGPNSSYQICNPISSAPLLTDVHHEVKALTRAVWIMNLHWTGQMKISYSAGEHSSNHSWHYRIKTTSVCCTIRVRVTVFTLSFLLLL